MQARLRCDSSDREHSRRKSDMPETVQPERQHVGEIDAVSLRSKERCIGEFHKTNNDEIRNPEARKSDEDEGQDGGEYIGKSSRVLRCVDAKQQAEGQRKQDREDVE